MYNYPEKRSNKSNEYVVAVVWSFSEDLFIYDIRESFKSHFFTKNISALVKLRDLIKML